VNTSIRKQWILLLLRWQEFASQSVAVFLTCHHSAGGKCLSVSKLGLLIDIQIATSHWPFLLCFKLEHVVHVICCLAFMAIQYAPNTASQSVLFSSSHASAQRTQQPLLPLLIMNSLCIHAWSNDAAFRWPSLLCGTVRSSFQETAPRKTAKNTVKHHDGGVRSTVANHRKGGESSVVVTTLINSTKCHNALQKYYLLTNESASGWKFCSPSNWHLLLTDW